MEQDSITINKKLVGSAFLFSLGSNLLILTGPLFMLQVYDRVLASRSEETLIVLFGLVVFSYSLLGILDFCRGRLMARAAIQIQLTYGHTVFNESLKNRSSFGSRSAMDSSIRDLDAIRNFLSSPALMALMDIFWSPLFLVILFGFHSLLGWFAIFGAAILTLATIVNQYATRKSIVRTSGDLHRTKTFSAEMMSQSETIAGMGMGPQLSNRWSKLQDQSLMSALKVSDLTGFFTSVTKALRLLLQSAILALGAYLVIQEQISAGAMIATSILMGRALAPVEQLLAHWQVLQHALLGRKSLKKVLKSPDGIKSKVTLPVPNSSLSCREVSLYFKGIEKPILMDVSFDVFSGEVLGVIGKSASGKTTLARSLLGVAEISRGKIKVGGAEIKQYDEKVVASIFGFLPQNVQLFTGTIAENIARMSAIVDSGKVISAAKKAAIHELILGLPDGYETKIGQNRPILSGGQIQRVGLARALYSEPQILILDEPNSSLDAEGTSALNSVLAEQKKAGRAAIIMTHRPSAIPICDKLLVLESGRTVAYGPRQEIMNALMRKFEPEFQGAAE